MDEYEQWIAESVNEIAGRDIYFDVGEIMKLPDSVAARLVAELIRWACCPTKVRPITIGRDCLKRLPAAWSEPYIKLKAPAVLDLSDFWEYSRLLELAEMISPELLKWAIPLGEPYKDDANIKETMESFIDRLDV